MYNYYLCINYNLWTTFSAINSLKHVSNSPQMYIRVSDNGQPQRSSTGTVTVIVDKDPDQLRCNQEPFSFSVPETSSVNFNLGTVIAGPGTVSSKI